LTQSLSKRNDLFRDKVGKKRIPVVLMLELTHACNLRCKGCGRIREYQDTMRAALSRQKAIEAIRQVNTPVVILSGGEPLLHPDTPKIAQYAINQRKIVYLCTNGLLLKKQLDSFTPQNTFYFNIHLDGPKEIHDELTGLPGATERVFESIKAALKAGFNVTTNSTIYRGTTPKAIATLFERLTALGVKGMMIAPAFAYEAGTDANTFTRAEAHVWFKQFYELWGDRNLTHTPLYMQFLRGERHLDCMPWGTITYNPQGWKSPCYLLTNTHMDTFQELITETEWDHYGPGKDSRCTDCMLHSGFEPSVVSSIRGFDDGWKSLMHILRWQMGK